MITALLASALLLAAPLQQTDTTFAVQAGGTLELEAHGGRAVIRSWDRDAIRIVASHAPGTDVRIGQRTSSVRVESTARGGPPNVQYEITVPRRYSMRIEGVNLQVTVEAVQGSVHVDNVEGAVTVRDVSGDVRVESVSGRVLIENVRGHVTATTVNQAVAITGVTGDIDAGTVNGSVVIRMAESANVRASTVNGLVEYGGTVQDGGRYQLSTHNGRITMGLPERANASVTITTSSGKVESAFPVQINALRGRDVSFTMGSGSARVELETFNGTVYLVRPAGR
jgi:DUF4097 and DUF4098 domain-containing protein YvlB